MKKFFTHIRSEWYRYIIEILVVVIGIMAAFSLDNWQESMKERKEQNELYSDFIQELQKDLIEIQGNTKFNRTYIASYERASQIILTDHDRKLADSLGIISIGLMEFSDFQKNGSAYELLGASGKLDMIDNKKILYGLQSLGMLYTYINRLEKNQETLIFEVVPQLFEYLSLKPFEVKQVEALYSYQFHNIFQVYLRLGNEKDGLYQQAESELKRLISDMENELK